MDHQELKDRYRDVYYNDLKKNPFFLRQIDLTTEVIMPVMVFLGAISIFQWVSGSWIALWVLGFVGISTMANKITQLNHDKAHLKGLSTLSSELAQTGMLQSFQRYFANHIDRLISTAVIPRKVNNAFSKLTPLLAVTYSLIMVALGIIGGVTFIVSAALMIVMLVMYFINRNIQQELFEETMVLAIEHKDIIKTFNEE